MDVQLMSGNSGGQIVFELADSSSSVGVSSTVTGVIVQLLGGEAPRNLSNELLLEELPSFSLAALGSRSSNDAKGGDRCVTASLTPACTPDIWTRSN